MIGHEIFAAFATVPGAEHLGSFFGLFVEIARFPGQAPMDQQFAWAEAAGVLSWIPVFPALIPLAIGAWLASRGFKRSGAALDLIWLSALVVVAASSGLGGVQEFLLRALLWMYALAWMAILAAGTAFAVLIVVALVIAMLMALVRPFLQSSADDVRRRR